MQNDDGSHQSAAPALKLQRLFWKQCKSIAPATQNDIRHFIKHVEDVT